MKKLWIQRTCVALVTAQWLLAAPAKSLSPVVAEPPATPQGIIWPEPSRPPQPMPPMQPPPRVVVQPNFQAPSASHCARPIETRELPDGMARPFQNKDSRRMERSSPEGEARADKAAPGVVGGTYAAPVAEALSAGRAAADMAMSVKPAPMPAPATPAAAPSITSAGKIAQAVAPHPDTNANTPQPAANVTAGMVDDNASFSEYLAFRNRTQVAHRARDVRERYLLEVNDTQGRPVPDAEVAVQSAAGYAMWARTDAAGQAWIHPNAFDPARAGFYDVTVRKGRSQASSVLQRGQKSSIEVTLGNQALPSRAKLDLVFLIDATGSMDDEIGKLKSSLRSIVDEVSQLPSRPDLCLGLVAYRDRGDEFFVRSHDLTNDLGAFQGVLNALRAGGGGDYPEAMNEAFNETVHRISWRGDQTTRLVVLLADAPPHLDYGGPQYDDDMLAALGKGIKVFSVGASGLDEQGEYIQRQIAQYTGGRFVFLTYAQATQPSSGPGRETVHDVRNYSVQTLDKLIVRLVREELGKLPRG